MQLETESTEEKIYYPSKAAHIRALIEQGMKLEEIDKAVEYPTSYIKSIIKSYPTFKKNEYIRNFKRALIGETFIYQNEKLVFHEHVNSKLHGEYFTRFTNGNGKIEVVKRAFIIADMLENYDQGLRP